MKIKRDIAIIGMAGRFPDAKNIEELYNNLANGTDSIREISEERLKNTGLPPGIEYRNCGYLADIDRFDYRFFNISPAEAQTMEPNQRILLEVVHELFDNSGYNIDHFRGTNTSVFVSEAGNEYYKLAQEISPTIITGNGREFLAARVASRYDLRGTAAMINTSCSSALAAVHFACNELVLGDAGMAVVGAVHIDLFPFNDNTLTLDLLSPDGKSRAFAADANGMSRGEMAGAVLLKPLDRALADKDIIHAVIKSSAVNNNADRSGSLTTPNSQSLAEVCRQAWEKAGIDPAKIRFIEAHGSGTPLGDSLEVEGLDLAFKRYTNDKKFCAISTIKANIGNNVFASGISGLIKAVLSLKNKVLFPAIHFDKPNPVIDFENSAVYVNDRFKKWDTAAGETRYAGVTSYGFSGTNCHLVLQEAPAANLNKKNRDSGSNRQDYLIAFSSKTAAGLKQNLIETRKALTGADYHLQDIAYTLNKGRKHYDYRIAILAGRRETLIKEIDHALTAAFTDMKPAPELEKLIFIFSDQGSMPGDLIGYFTNNHPVFAASFKECQDMTSTPGNRHFLDFAFQYSFYRLLAAYGISTDNILTIGIGKLIAKVISAEFTLPEGIRATLAYQPEEITHLPDRVQKLVNNETKQEPVFFIDMGPGGTLTNELEKQKDENGNFNVARVTGIKKDPLSVLLKSLYHANYHLNWDQIYTHFDGQKIPLPGYQFDRKRCWLRDDPVEAFFNLVRLPRAEDRQRTGDRQEKDRQPGHTGQGGSIEEKIAAAWQKTLKLEKIKPGDNFFLLGGHSLLATQVILAIKKEFHLELNFADIFNHPTLQSLSEYIHQQILSGDKTVDYSEIEAAPAKEYYPLSFAQQRMYLLQDIEPTGTSYNTPVKILLEGTLDKKRLETVFRQLIHRHESLRTSFKKYDGRLIQRIHRENYRLPVTTTGKDFIQPFNLAEAPLLRLRLIEIAEDKYELLIDMHHIITDATSMQVLARDFMLLYNHQDLPSLKIQYKDFSQWQNHLFASGKLKQQETYWLNRFSHDIPVLELPYDYPAPALRSLDKGDLIIFFIRDEIRERLLHQVRETGTTLFIFLLAVYYILLFKYTGQRDIVVGSTVTGRNHPGLQNIIGMFVNMLPMRCCPGEAKPFAAFLKEVKVTALDAYNNQDYPLDQLVVRLELPRAQNRKQLFNTEFAMNNIEMQELKIPGLSLEISAEEAKFAKFDLHFQLTEINNAIRIVLRYSSELFKRSTVEGIKDHYLEVLEQVTREIDIKPGAIKLSHTLMTPETHIKEELSGNFTL